MILKSEITTTAFYTALITSFFVLKSQSDIEEGGLKKIRNQIEKIFLELNVYTVFKSLS